MRRMNPTIFEQCSEYVGRYTYAGTPVSYTLLKSDVTRRDHMVHCHGSQECWFMLCQFCCRFHLRWHSLHITLKLQHWCTCAVGTHEPGNHDNGASDVWTLTAYFVEVDINVNFPFKGKYCQILDFDWVWNTIATVVDIEWHEMRPWSLWNSSAGGFWHKKNTVKVLELKTFQFINNF